MIYGLASYNQYCGSQIFRDSPAPLPDGVARHVAEKPSTDSATTSPEPESRRDSMFFCELPFRNVEDFDYPAIA